MKIDASITNKIYFILDKSVELIYFYKKISKSQLPAVKKKPEVLVVKFAILLIYLTSVSFCHS